MPLAIRTCEYNMETGGIPAANIMSLCSANSATYMSPVQGKTTTSPMVLQCAPVSESCCCHLFYVAWMRWARAVCVDICHICFVCLVCCPVSSYCSLILCVHVLQGTTLPCSAATVRSKRSFRATHEFEECGQSHFWVRFLANRRWRKERKGKRKRRKKIIQQWCFSHHAQHLFGKTPKST